jgi:hypothetical protein
MSFLISAPFPFLDQLHDISDPYAPHPLFDRERRAHQWLVHAALVQNTGTTVELPLVRLAL